MKRRSFIAGATSAVALLAQISPAASVQKRRPARTTLGLRFRELRDQYHRDLFNDFLPFMERYVIDPEFGGFRCNIDHLGNRLNHNKLSWFEGRGTWVYSFLYNNLAREQKYLDVARRSIDLIKRLQPHGDDLWPKEITREGQPLTSADGEVYGDLFIAEGFAEFSKATGDRALWDEAKQILLKCVRLYDRPDYRPTIGQTYLGPSAAPFPGARIQGVWMTLIRAGTQMLEMRRDPEIEAVATRCVDAILNHHYNRDFGLINELLNHDLSRPANEYAQLVYTGHCIETLWMLMLEAVRRRDETLFDRFAEWFKRHVEVAWDDIYSGVFRNLQNVEKNAWVVDKVLWAQEEVLIGSLLIVERRGYDWAVEMFRRTNSYVRENYDLKKHGSPLWMYASDRKASYEAFLKMPKRVENFHHPRHLMLNLLSLERIIRKA
jgi:N-acylglucosamine 2-epimerase